MGPPELHVVLIGLRGTPQAVDEVEQAAVLVVPAGLDGLVKILTATSCCFLSPFRLASSIRNQGTRCRGQG